MKASLKIATIRKIDIKIHWTFLLIIGWFVIIGIRNNQDATSILLTIAFVLAIFTCVVLHELGHSLAAQRYHIQTKGITLLPIGGVASLERIPENPKEELVVAIAGPLVNVVIAGVLSIIILLSLQFDFELKKDWTELTMNSFLINLTVANIFLVVFNLIPAFPMDGGRIFRALLSMKIDRIKATRIAARAGQIFAIGFTLLGLFFNPFLIFIGVFVYLGATAEGNFVETTGLLKGFTVGDVMRRQFATLAMNETVNDAMQKLLDGSDTDFLVLDDSKKVQGLLRRKDLIQAIGKQQETSPVTEFMTTELKILSTKDELSNLAQNTMLRSFDLMPVYENGNLVGVLDKDNLSEFLMIQGARSRT